MNNALYVTISGIGVMLILLMLFNFGSKNVMSKGIDDKMFTTMLYMNMILLITDALMWVFDGKLSLAAAVIMRFDTALYYILQPAVCFVWFLYCEYKLTGDKRKIIKQLPWLSIPATVTVILTILSLYTPIFFNIDAQNHYTRGPYFYLNYIFTFFYIIVMYINMLRMIRKDPKTPKLETINFLYLYPILPIICAVLQGLFYGISVIWIGSAISFLVIYFNLQNTLITTDALTGLNNRRRFETFINDKMNSPIKHPILFALMVDIDKFRDINNTYGHIVGDEALKSVAEILKSAVTRNDFIARVGGEEFMIIGERENAALVFETMKAIKDQTMLANQKNKTPYRLSMSIGYSIMKAGEIRTAEEIIKEADKRMYNEKERINGEI